MRSAHYLHRMKHTQRGTALVMALVFLLLMTMLGITAINTSTLEERMAGNTKDQNLAFQAAETALRAGELWVESRTSEAQLTVNTANGIYDPAPATSGIENWDSVVWSGTTNLVTYPGVPGTASTTGTLAGVSTQPKYIIEILGSSPGVPPAGNIVTVRITARGTGASDNTVSMVQSIVSKAF